jgi:photosynthetic reaction center H subunit
MQPAPFEPPFDLAFAALYAFWILFALLVLYLHSESKREGYPLVTDRAGERPWGFFGWRPKPKTFNLPHGGTVQAPREEALKPVAATQTMPFFGAPYAPTGNPLLDGVGPAAWADRADVPDLTFDDATPKIVPLRSNAAKGWHVPEGDDDPRGMEMRAADGVVAGKCVDLWVDRSEALLRYIEVELAGSGRHVLVPATLMTIEGARTKHVMVSSVLGKDFADAPGLRNPEQVTLREEDRVVAFFGGGHMYSTKTRAEPFL